MKIYSTNKRLQSAFVLRIIIKSISYTNTQKSTYGLPFGPNVSGTKVLVAITHLSVNSNHRTAMIFIAGDG